MHGCGTMGSHSHSRDHAMSDQPSTSSPLADIPRLLAAAPHRPLFLAGTVAVMLSMAWWALELTSLRFGLAGWPQDRKSTRLNSSHPSISYAVFCLKKKKI